MFRYVGAVVSLLVLIGVFYFGYKQGSKGVEEARAELAQIRDATKRVQEEDAVTRKRIEQRLVEVDAEHKAKVDELQRSFATERSELQANLDKTKAAGTALHAKADSATGDLARIRAQMQTADAARLETLRKREERVLALEAKAKTGAASADCLELPVPGPLVQTLNRAAAQ